MVLHEEDQGILKNEKYLKLQAAVDVANDQEHRLKLIGTFFKDTGRNTAQNMSLVATCLSKAGVLPEETYFKLHSLIITGLATNPKYWVDNA